MDVNSPKSTAGSPMGSPRSPAGSRSSRSGSRSSARSAKSGSRSRSASPASKSSGSRSGSGSRSRSTERSRSPEGSVKAGSRSPVTKRALSRSTSQSPAKSGSRSATPARSKSGSRSGSRSSRSSSGVSSKSARSKKSEPEKLAVDDASDADAEKRTVADGDAEDAKSDAGSRVGAGSDVEQETKEPQIDTRIDVEVPHVSTDLGKAIHFVKLPNFLSIEPRPFDPDTYEDEINFHERVDEEGRARLKLKGENTIRWRHSINDKGEVVKQSNANFVKWSDGSLTLHIGSEQFKVHKQPLEGNHNHLFIRQGSILQGQAVLGTKLAFQPHSTDSATHRKMTLSLAERSQKAQGIKVLSTVGTNPEERKEEVKKQEKDKIVQEKEKMKQEDKDKLRASVRREGTPRRVLKRVSGGRGRPTASYLEGDADDDDDENAISLSAIKNRYKPGQNPRQNSRAEVYSSDDKENEGSDIEDRMKARKAGKAKALKISDDEDDDDGPRPSTSRHDDGDYSGAAAARGQRSGNDK